MRLTKVIWSLCFVFSLVAATAQPGTSDIVEREGKRYYEHKIVKGNTLWSLQRMYGVDKDVIIEHNPNAADGLKKGEVIYIPVVGEPDPPVATGDGFGEHIVAKGETIYGICKKYDISQDQLIQDNPEVKNGLKQGQVLKIRGAGTSDVTHVDPPDPGTDTAKTHTHIIYEDSLVRHVVQKDETLYSLSKRYMVTQDKIREANDDLSNGLKEGDTINVPLRLEKHQIIQKDVAQIDTNKVPIAPITYKEVYNVVVLAPIDLDINAVREAKRDQREERKIYGPTKIGIDFYAGVKLALDSLRQAGVSTNLSVYDTQKDSTTVKTILGKEALKQADLIIGPFYGYNVKIVAKFAKENEIHMVIPVPHGNKVLYKNPYVSKAVTSTTTKLKSMAGYIAKHYSDANIILVDSKKKKDEYMFKVMKETLESELQEGNAATQELVISSVENYSAKHLHGSVSKSKINVIIACSKDVGFASNFMTKVNTIKNSWDKYSADIRVFVLDDWENFSTIDPLAKSKLQMHYVSNSFIDYDTLSAQSFIMAYRDKFGYDPDEMGFMGFDLAYNYVGAMSKFGTGFNDRLSLLHSQGVHTEFNMVQVQEGSGFENRSVYILRYNNFDLFLEEW